MDQKNEKMEVGGGENTRNGMQKQQEGEWKKAHRRSYSVGFVTEDHSQEEKKKQFESGQYSSSSNRRRALSFDLTHHDHELGLKKRLASYKLFHLEGKMKNSLKKSCRWIKGKYDILLYGSK